MSEPTPNAALLNETLAYIEAHPDEWDQAHWHCGTTCCFAGRAALLDGAEWSRGGWNINPSKSVCVVAREDDPGYDVFTMADRRYVHVETRARRILGLTWEQSQELFRSGNGLDDIRRLVAELTGDAS